jgi:hypothetical protein
MISVNLSILQVEGVRVQWEVQAGVFFFRGYSLELCISSFV